MTLGFIWKLLRETASRWNQVNAPRLGASLAFYTMLSVAPLIVVSVAIAGLVFGRQAAEGQLLWQIQDLAGREGGQAIQAMLVSASRPAAGVAATVIGAAVLLYGASQVFAELRDSLNAIWGVSPLGGNRITSIIRSRFFLFALVVGIGFLLIVSLLVSAALSAAGKFFGEFLPVPEVVLHVLNLAISFIGVTLLFALLYKLVPDVRIEWGDVWIGAAVTALLFSLGKFAIGLYLGKASVGSAYGAAGSLVIFLVWVYYTAQVFFLGAEFTRAFAERRGSCAKARA